MTTMWVNPVLALSLHLSWPLIKLTSAACHFTLLASVSCHWEFLNLFDSLTSLMIGSRPGPVLGPSLLTSCMTLLNLRVLCHL